MAFSAGLQFIAEFITENNWLGALVTKQFLT